ncbi:MAG: hypothetical protein MJ078_04450 [Clostridia bacterium]|nr:hypothetical protein [Clostridia bacterium]
MPAVKEFGYEYDASFDAALWEQTRGKTTAEKLFGALCLRSGRDAIKAVAESVPDADVVMPALSCDSMVVPFTSNGMNVTFYPYCKDYSVDGEALFRILEGKRKNVLLLYMDYFGKPSFSDDLLKFIREKYPGILFLEDRTHNLPICPKRTFQPEFTVASLRKWISVPDGGLSWTEKDLHAVRLGESGASAGKRLAAQRLRHDFRQTGKPEYHSEFRKVFSTVTDMIDEDPLPGRMSLYAYELARRTDWQFVKEQRKKNASVLIEALKKAGIRLVQDVAGESDVYVEILINNRDDVQRKLASEGIFCTVIWPLSPEQRKACPVAEYTEEHMLAIYCDQRYSEEEMDYIAKRVTELCYE